MCFRLYSNLYSEEIFREELDLRIKVVIKNLRYADDPVLLATNLEDPKEPLIVVTSHSSLMGLKPNVKKTKWSVVSKIRQYIKKITSYKDHFSMEDF